MARVRPVYRYLYTVLALSCAVAAWLMLLYFPLQERIQRYQRAAQQAEQQCIAQGHAQGACKKLKQSINAMERKLLAYKQDQRSSQYSQSPLATILNHAQKAGLSIASCSAGDVRDKGWYKEHYVSISCAGSLESMAAFFAVLACHERVSITYEHITITKSGAGDNLFSLSGSFVVLAVA
jgi:Tfp pilus assembly protein PilO